jgi:sugar (pentulose or hexulose) kinase
VLREERFSPSELRELSAGIDSEADPPVPGYYPLPRGAVGERFPTNDPELRPVLDPVPESRRDFLHSILHAVGRVEAQGYGLLASLGASPLRRVYTCGGGARNPTWTRMRRRMLGVEVEEAPQTEAAVGVALLALRGGGR